MGSYPASPPAPSSSAIAAPPTPTASATPFAAAAAALVYAASFDTVGFLLALALIHHTLVGDLVGFPEPVAVGDRTHMTEDVVYR